MTSNEFCNWLSIMNFTDSDAAKALGIGSRNTIARYKEKGAPTYIALACTALVCKLRPFPDHREDLNFTKPAT